MLYLAKSNTVQVIAIVVGGMFAKFASKSLRQFTNSPTLCEFPE